MQIDYLVLADAVAAVGGKHYIHGGGWDTLFSRTFPFVHPTLAPPSADERNAERDSGGDIDQSPLGVRYHLRVGWKEAQRNGDDRKTGDCREMK